MGEEFNFIYGYLIFQSLEKNYWTRELINKVDWRPLEESIFTPCNQLGMTSHNHKEEPAYVYFSLSFFLSPSHFVF